MAVGQYNIENFPRAIAAPNGNWATSGVNTVYENLEFAVNTGTSNYNVLTQVSGAFTIVPTGRNINIRTDATITVKFNDTGNNAITITSTEGQFRTESLEFTNIFITNNSGGTANVKIFFT